MKLWIGKTLLITVNPSYSELVKGCFIHGIISFTMNGMVVFYGLNMK
jgi:hypothetical protein